MFLIVCFIVCMLGYHVSNCMFYCLYSLPCFRLYILLYIVYLMFDYMFYCVYSLKFFLLCAALFVFWVIMFLLVCSIVCTLNYHGSVLVSFININFSVYFTIVVKSIFTLIFSFVKQNLLIFIIVFMLLMTILFINTKYHISVHVVNESIIYKHKIS